MKVKDNCLIKYACAGKVSNPRKEVRSSYQSSSDGGNKRW